MQFLRLDDMTPEQQAAVEELGQAGKVIVREQQRSVVNLGWLKPVEAARKGEAQIPFIFNRDHFRRAWQRGGVRPPTGAEHPERTKEQFCAFDAAHSDYVYSPVYVKHLAKICATEQGFRETTGRGPQSRRITKADLQAS